MSPPLVWLWASSLALGSAPHPVTAGLAGRCTGCSTHLGPDFSCREATSPLQRLCVDCLLFFFILLTDERIGIFPFNQNPFKPDPTKVGGVQSALSSAWD